MVLPNYKKSIVNLMASIAGAYGVKTDYAPLKMLPSSQLKEAKKIGLLVIDGLGAEFVKKNRKKGGLFDRYWRGEITSVFPSTTTAAITSFLTGKAPREHGWLAWLMNVKELGGPIISLPWLMRGNKKGIGMKADKFFKGRALTEKIKTVAVVPQKIAKTEFNKKFNKKARIIGYKEKSLKSWLYQTRRVIKKEGRKYVYSYWPGLDTIGHHEGMESGKAKQHFKEIERGLEKLVESIKGTGTVLLITGDHGLIDHQKKEEIILNRHKEFYECLSAPVFGEKRAAFCNVREAKREQFKSYVKKKLGKYCKLVKPEELIDKSYFGLTGRGKEHPQLKERIGDYVLLAKKNYVFRDFLPGEKVKFHVGDHGGLSRKEMMVPLIAV